MCGFYFNPSEEIDDICRIVSPVVNRCPDRNRLLLGGDINLRPNTEDFEALCELLEEEEIILRSDLPQQGLIYTRPYFYTCQDGYLTDWGI